MHTRDGRALFFDPGIRYGCIQCGKSCQRDWNIWVRREYPQRIGSEMLLQLRVLPENAFVEVEEALRLGRDEAGCHFTNGHQCAIHHHAGYDMKPYQCQQYPLLITETPEGLRVSASYTCTAVLQGRGEGLQAQVEVVRQCLEQGAALQGVFPGEGWEESREFEPLLEAMRAESGWDQALRRAVLVLLAGRLNGEQGTPAQWWGQYRNIWVESEDDSTAWLLGALLKPCLTQHDGSLWAAVDQALLERGPVKLPEFDYAGSAMELIEWAGKPLPDESDLDRYRDSLWFRKQHLMCGGLFAGVMMLWTVGPLYRVLCRLSDSHSALERLELNLICHSRLGPRIYPLICDYWAQTFQAK